MKVRAYKDMHYLPVSHSLNPTIRAVPQHAGDAGAIGL